MNKKTEKFKLQRISEKAWNENRDFRIEWKRKMEKNPRNEHKINKNLLEKYGYIAIDDTGWRELEDDSE